MIRSRAAKVNNTKANSPPAGNVKPRRQDVCPDWPDARPRSVMATSLIARKPPVTAITRSGMDRSRPRLAAMPTATKNRPSSRPLNGSRSASSSCRNSLSASSTPARNAPRDMESPTWRARIATTMTVSNAAAVKTSVTLIRANGTRSAGRSNSRPPTTIAAMTANSFANVNRPFPPPRGSTVVGAINGNAASTGRTARS